MRPYPGFIISIFLTLVILPFLAQSQTVECRKLNLTVEVTPTNGNQLGSITVKNADPSVDFTLHLLGAQHEQLKVVGGTIRNIPAGKYDLVIHSTDGAYCSETRKLTIN